MNLLEKLGSAIADFSHHAGDNSSIPKNIYMYRVETVVLVFFAMILW